MNWRADKPSGNGKPKWQPYNKPSTTYRKPRKGVIESFSRPDNARIGSGRKSSSSPDGRTPLMPKQLPLPDNSCGNCL